MAVYRAQFRWPLPPARSTVERYVAMLSESAGYPSRIDIVRETADGVTAVLSLPRLLKGNFISLSDDLCELEFAPLPFFWGHATHTVQELGGTFTKPVIADRPEWRRRKWRELKWTERALIKMGLGHSVM